jgi:hypothetical protein
MQLEEVVSPSARSMPQLEEAMSPPARPMPQLEEAVNPPARPMLQLERTVRRDVSGTSQVRIRRERQRPPIGGDDGGVAAPVGLQAAEHCMTVSQGLQSEK